MWIPSWRRGNVYQPSFLSTPLVLNLTKNVNSRKTQKGTAWKACEDSVNWEGQWAMKSLISIQFPLLILLDEDTRQQQPVGLLVILQKGMRILCYPSLIPSEPALKSLKIEIGVWTPESLSNKREERFCFIWPKGDLSPDSDRWINSTTNSN